MKVLFVVAHPDDAEVMLGYAIAAADEAYVVVGTNGEASTLDMCKDGCVKRGRRRYESEAGLGVLGVPRESQFYLKLPDGNVVSRFTKTVSMVEGVIKLVHPDRIITTGEDGYDGHPDHIAMHQVALAAAGDIDVYALDRDGAEQATGNKLQKLMAMAKHISQRTNKDINTWGDSGLYDELIAEGERYTRIVQ